MEAAQITTVDPVLMGIASVSPPPEGYHRYQMRLCRRHFLETEHWLAVTAEIRQGRCNTSGGPRTDPLAPAHNHLKKSKIPADNRRRIPKGASEVGNGCVQYDVCD
jgi:hypothetical protein